jgi:hypothetical protein
MSEDYDEGVRDGRISHLERRADDHDIRGDNHERRLMYMERIIYGMMAILGFTSVVPELMGFLSALAQ